MRHICDSIGCNPLRSYWVMRLMMEVGSNGYRFITPRSAVRSRPRYHRINNLEASRISTLPDFARLESKRTQIVAFQVWQIILGILREFWPAPKKFCPQPKKRPLQAPYT